MQEWFLDCLTKRQVDPYTQNLVNITEKSTHSRAIATVLVLSQEGQVLESLWKRYTTESENQSIDFKFFYTFPSTPILVTHLHLPGTENFIPLLESDPSGFSLVDHILYSPDTAYLRVPTRGNQLLVRIITLGAERYKKVYLS